MATPKVLSKTTGSFVASNHIIHSLIYQQAGTVSKAIMELVMNEIDAKANLVSVTIGSNLKSIVVEGDGVGFQSREEIDELFACFGFDHSTEKEKQRNRDFGMFGIGRGQIFAFGRSVWKTNQFKLTADLKNNKTQGELPYDCVEFDGILYEGCKVEIELYNPLEIYELNSLKRNLKDQLKFTRQPVFINEKQVNVSPDDYGWTNKNESGTLLFKAATSGSENGLLVYNKGVFVRRYSHSSLGISGELTSYGEKFDVNMARNDIQQATCELWKEAKNFLLPLVIKKKKTDKIGDKDAIFLVQKLISCDVAHLDGIVNKKIFSIITGKKISITTLAGISSGRVTMANKLPSSAGEKIHKTKLAAVLCPVFVSELGFDSINEFMDALNEAKELLLKHQRENPYHPFTTRTNYELRRKIEVLSAVEFEPLEEQVNSSMELIQPSDMTKIQKYKLKAIDTINNDVANNAGLTPRALKLGVAIDACAWTDGKTFVAIEKSYLDKCFSMGHTGMFNLYMTIIHEYCHENVSLGDHIHGAEFDARFREIVEKTSLRVLESSIVAFERYFRYRKKDGLDIPSNEYFRADVDISKRMRAAAIGE